jgi:hypothetical protein
LSCYLTFPFWVSSITFISCFHHSYIFPNLPTLIFFMFCHLVNICSSENDESCILISVLISLLILK